MTQALARTTRSMSSSALGSPTMDRLSQSGLVLASPYELQVRYPELADARVPRIFLHQTNGESRSPHEMTDPCPEPHISVAARPSLKLGSRPRSRLSRSSTRALVGNLKPLPRLMVVSSPPSSTPRAARPGSCRPNISQAVMVLGAGYERPSRVSWWVVQRKWTLPYLATYWR